MSKISHVGLHALCCQQICFRSTAKDAYQIGWYDQQSRLHALCDQALIENVRQQHSNESESGPILRAHTDPS